LYRKSLEGKERLLYEKKRKIKEALQGLNFHKLFFFFFLILIPCANGDFTEGKPIPTELRSEEAELRHQIDLEDENTAGMPNLFFIFLICKPALSALTGLNCKWSFRLLKF
jgi:U3 small nucleolar ribonucleoprotein protein IMP4